MKRIIVFICLISILVYPVSASPFSGQGLVDNTFMEYGSAGAFFAGALMLGIAVNIKEINQHPEVRGNVIKYVQDTIDEATVDPDTGKDDDDKANFITLFNSGVIMVASKIWQRLSRIWKYGSDFNPSIKSHLTPQGENLYVAFTVGDEVPYSGWDGPYNAEHPAFMTLYGGSVSTVPGVAPNRFFDMYCQTPSGKIFQYIWGSSDSRYEAFYWNDNSGKYLSIYGGNNYLNRENAYLNGQPFTYYDRLIKTYPSFEQNWADRTLYVMKGEYLSQEDLQVFYDIMTGNYEGPEPEPLEPIISETPEGDLVTNSWVSRGIVSISDFLKDINGTLSELYDAIKSQEVTYGQLMQQAGVVVGTPDYVVDPDTGNVTDEPWSPPVTDSGIDTDSALGWSAQIQDKLPFSFVYNILDLFNALDADPVAPAFSFPIPNPFSGSNSDGTYQMYQIDIDLSDYDTFMTIIRTFEVISFAIFCGLKILERF